MSSTRHFPNDVISRITIEPGKLGGKPCIRGLRISVAQVLDMLASRMSEAQILEDFPDLEHEDFPAIYAFASEMISKAS